MKRLYFVGFGLVTFLVPLLIFYGLWVSQETARDKKQIQALLQQKAAAVATNVEIVLNQQLERLESTAIFLQDTDRTPEKLAQRIQWAGEAIRVVKFLGLANGDGSVVANSLPDLGSLLPRDVWADVQQVNYAKTPLIKSRLTNIEDPDVDSPGIMLYVPMEYRGRNYVIVGALPYSYVQNIVEQYGAADGVLAQNVVDNNQRLIARTSGIEEFFGQTISEKFRAATSGGRLQGTFETTSLDGHQILSTFKFVPSLHWYFNVSIRADYTSNLLARSDDVVLFTAIIGLILFVSIGIILLINMFERQIANQKLEDERAYSATTTKALQERELLLREVYHRVKNNLQVLQSILRLSSRSFAPDVRQKIDSITARVDAIAEVHAMLYQSSNLATLDFKSYIETLVPQIDKVYKRPDQEVKTFINAQSVPVSLDMAVPLGLAFVELLANAYKHGLKDMQNGVLSINLSREKTDDVEFGVLEIEDNGPGLGVGFQDSPSLGLKLVERLAQQLNGDVAWPVARSSHVRLRFALCDRAKAADEFPTQVHAVKS